MNIHGFVCILCDRLHLVYILCDRTRPRDKTVLPLSVEFLFRPCTIGESSAPLLGVMLIRLCVCVCVCVCVYVCSFQDETECVCVCV